MAKSTSTAAYVGIGSIVVVILAAIGGLVWYGSQPITGTQSDGSDGSGSGKQKDPDYVYAFGVKLWKKPGSKSDA